MQGILVKYALKVHLLDWKCHYFPRGGRGLERTTLSLCHFVTIGLGGVGVKTNLDNVTKYEDFFLKASLNRNFFLDLGRRLNFSQIGKWI